MAGLVSSGGRDSKEKKVFISLIGTKGMGCRWVHGLLNETSGQFVPSFIDVLRRR